MRRAISITELNKARIKAMPFADAWLKSYGQPEYSGAWLIWGASGQGKTIHAMQIAKYLANWTRVAYNSLEQGMSLSLKRAVDIVNFEECKRRVVFLDKEPIRLTIQRLEKRKSPNVIIIDSIQYSQMKYRDYVELRERFRNKLFIFISHADGREPSSRVAKSVRYDSDVKVFVQGFAAYPTSRFGGGEKFVIWEKGHIKAQGLPYENELIAEAEEVDYEAH